MPTWASQTTRPGSPGSEDRNARQFAGWAVGKASARQSLGLPATYPAAQKTSKATRPAGIRLPAGVQQADAEGQVIEQERALDRPGAGAMGIEDHRREQLHPVGDELAVIGLAKLAGLGIEAEAMGAVAGDPRGAPVAGARADGVHRLGDPAGDELVVARGLRPLAPLDAALAVLAGLVPGLLARQ
jgi:hypothetical protein